jgi:hypothetical protein
MVRCTVECCVTNERYIPQIKYTDKKVERQFQPTWTADLSGKFIVSVKMCHSVFDATVSLVEKCLVRIFA